MTQIIQPTNVGNLISVGAVNAKALNGRQLGIPQPQLASISVAPQAASITALSDPTEAISNAYIPLRAGANVTVKPGVYNGFTNTTDTLYYFDTPRPVYIDIIGVSIVKVFIWGFDEDNVFMTECLEVFPGFPAYGVGKKAFAGVTRVYVQGTMNVGDFITVGTSAIIGLPYVLDNVNRILGTGNFGFGNSFGTVSTYAIADLNVATATTGDIRGTVNLNGFTLDGLHRLNVAWIMDNDTLDVNEQNYSTVYGVPQYAQPYF